MQNITFYHEFSSNFSKIYQIEEDTPESNHSKKDGKIYHKKCKNVKKNSKHIYIFHVNL